MSDLRVYLCGAMLDRLELQYVLSILECYNGNTEYCHLNRGHRAVMAQADFHLLPWCFNGVLLVPLSK